MLMATSGYETSKVCSGGKFAGHEGGLFSARQVRICMRMFQSSQSGYGMAEEKRFSRRGFLPDIPHTYTMNIG